MSISCVSYSCLDLFISKHFSDSLFIYLFIVGDTFLFCCSGTVVEFFEESNMIVTVANLVKCPDDVEVANNLKVGSIFLL